MHEQLLPAGLLLIVVHPGLLWQVLSLPPCVLLVLNGGEGGLVLLANAAFGPNASIKTDPANMRVFIRAIVILPFCN